MHTSCYFKMHMPPGNGSTMRCDERKIRPNDIPATDPIANAGQKAGVGKTRLRGMEGKRIVYLFPVSKKKNPSRMLSKTWTQLYRLNPTPLNDHNLKMYEKSENLQRENYHQFTSTYNNLNHF